MAAEWLTAIGTTAAVIVALAGLLREQVLRRRADERDRRQARRAQAEQVSAWYSGGSEQDRTPIALENASHQPAYRAW